MKERLKTVSWVRGATKIAHMETLAHLLLVSTSLASTSHNGAPTDASMSLRTDTFHPALLLCSQTLSLWLGQLRRISVSSGIARKRLAPPDFCSYHCLVTSARSGAFPGSTICMVQLLGFSGFTPFGHGCAMTCAPIANSCINGDLYRLPHLFKTLQRTT